MFASVELTLGRNGVMLAHYLGQTVAGLVLDRSGAKLGRFAWGNPLLLKPLPFWARLRVLP